MNGTSKTYLIESIKTVDWKTVSVIGPIVIYLFWLCLDSHNGKLFLTKEEYREDQQKICNALDKLDAGQQRLIDHLLRKK